MLRCGMKLRDSESFRKACVEYGSGPLAVIPLCGTRPAYDDIQKAIHGARKMQSFLKARLAAVIGACALSVGMAAHAADEPRRPECLAPAQPGGGFDLTCRLATE